MRKIVLGVIILTVIVGGIIFYLVNKSQLGQDTTIAALAGNNVAPSASEALQPVDITASFAIFTRGTFRIFTDSKYHNQNESVFIESSSPNIVRVKNKNVTWNEFFKTLPFSLDKNCLVTGTGQTFCTNSNERLGFYLNGIEDSDALGRVIKAGDVLLVSYGRNDSEEIKNQLLQVPKAE